MFFLFDVLVRHSWLSGVSEEKTSRGTPDRGAAFMNMNDVARLHPRASTLDGTWCSVRRQVGQLLRGRRLQQLCNTTAEAIDVCTLHCRL